MRRDRYYKVLIRQIESGCTCAPSKSDATSTVRPVGFKAAGRLEDKSVRKRMKKYRNYVFNSLPLPILDWCVG